MVPGEDYKRHWDEKFRTHRWGRYPPEDLVRFVGRTYGGTDHGSISILEVGCGPGANLWFLHREGFRVAGIDGSAAAIEAAGARLDAENRGMNPAAPDLKVGDFSRLPWPDAHFDLVIDIFAIYANTMAVIGATAEEIHRVLKPRGRFYTKVWGLNTTGYGSGRLLEPGTYDAITSGPCKDMGVSHFFSEEGVRDAFSRFEPSAIDLMTRTDRAKGHVIEEYACSFLKPGPAPGPGAERAE